MQKANHKIIVAGLEHESCTFTSRRTELEDLRIKRGEALPPEVISFLKESNIEVVQTMFCSGVPGGVIRRQAYETVTEEILQRITDSLPCNGILLSMHGSMEVEGIGHGETAFLKSFEKE